MERELAPDRTLHACWRAGAGGSVEVMWEQEPVTIFAETDYRGKHVQFGIRKSDRRYHMAIIGRTGMGKTTLLETLVRSDINSEDRSGCALLDPHGDLAESVIASIPAHRRDDLVYFNPAEPAGVLGVNILELAGNKPHLVVSGVISVFKKIWADSWGPRMEHLFRYALSTLVEVEGTTLADVSRLFLDKGFRASILRDVNDVTIHNFWAEEYERYTPSFRTEAISPVLNKTGQWLASAPLRAVITKKHSDFDLRTIMDEGRIFIANLSKGKLGEDGSALLGSLLSTKLELAALSRAGTPIEQRREFYIYIDEFPLLATASFTNMFSEARKYGAAITVAAQFIEQLDEPVRNSLFENCGTVIAFRVGPESARYLASQFSPVFTKEDLMNRGKYEICLRMMIDGVPCRPFSARTLGPGVQRGLFD